MDFNSLERFMYLRSIRHASVVLNGLASSIYMGARDEARDLALTLARACSPTSARS